MFLQESSRGAQQASSAQHLSIHIFLNKSKRKNYAKENSDLFNKVK